MTLRLVFVLLVGSRVASCLDAAAPQNPSTHHVTCDGVSFTLPKGLTVTKVAGPPLVKWPIVADWDPAGRLVVAESGGVGWPIQEHNKQRLHRIIRLVDRDGDGNFDDSIVAAKGLAFPEGVLCLGDDILVSAPPVIWKLTDADGDGRCEDRDVWFDGTTVTNCANDLHGPYLGRDGWIYWCKGAFGKQTHDLLDGRTLRSTAAHIYRRRLSGGAIEPLISGGMDNPVEVAFLESGEKFFTSTFLHHPGDNLRDGIGHAVYGSVFGKDHPVIHDLTRTGNLMKPMIELGPAAPSGLLAATGHCKSNFGIERQTPVLVSALFNLHKLVMHRLSESGSSYKSDDYDLISTDRADFHPTDVLEDDHGNLLLIDTGGWYDLCCPTSRVDQKTASGGIYRIEPVRDPLVAREVTRKEDVPWDQLGPSQMLELFGDPRPWVRRSAKQRLRQLGDQVIPICRSIIDDPLQPLDSRQSAIWALCRIDSPASAAALVELLDDKPPSLLLPILHSLSLRRISQGQRAVAALLRHPSPAVRRVAAQTLGRSAGPEVVRPLLDSFSQATDDQNLQHALTYALIEIGRRHGKIDYVGQADRDAAVHAALVATRELGQANGIDPSTLIDCLDRDDAQLRSTALALLAARTEAVPLSMERLRSAWADLETLESDPPEFLSVLLRSWRDHPAVSRLISDWYSSAPDLNRAKQLFLADHLNQFYPFGSQTERMRVIDTWLNAADADVQQRLLASLREVEYSVSGEIIVSSLLRRAAMESEAGRLRWMSALPPGSKLSDPKLAKAVIEAVAHEDSERVLQAARVLDRVRLDGESAQQLLGCLDQIQARHLPTVVEALHRSGDAKFQLATLRRLKGLPAARTLRDDYLTNLFRESEPAVRRTAEEVSEALVQPTVDIRNAVDETLSKLPPGDPVRGLQVFRGNKAACSSCHQMGYIGRNVGPVLTKIGRSRTAEALLEAILFPSSRLEQSYRSTQVLTTDGQLYNGLVENREGGMLKIRIGADRVVSVPIDDIERERASEVSVMPSGMGDVLSDQELADLLALLQAAR